MISPTGLTTRNFDQFGSGHYGAPRDGGKRMHRGTDFICVVGQEIVCPSDGMVAIRKSRPHANEKWSGIILKNPHFTIQMFYFTPLDGIWGKSFSRGDVIGHAQDISEKYPGITPHVHLRIRDINPELFYKLNLP